MDQRSTLEEIEEKFLASTRTLQGLREKSLASRTAAAQSARGSSTFPPMVNRTRSEEERDRQEQERESAGEGFVPSWQEEEADPSREIANEGFTLAQQEVAESPERGTRARRPTGTLERRATNGSALIGRTSRVKQALPANNVRRRNALVTSPAVPAKRTAITPVQGGQTKRQRGELETAPLLSPPVAMNCDSIPESTVPELQLRVKGS
jgi:hypothetical protein